MTEKQKKVLKLSIAFAVSFAVYPAANAMHIMEGYLPAGYCIAWGVICLPFLVKGFFNIRKQFRENKKAITMLAMAGIFLAAFLGDLFTYCVTSIQLALAFPSTQGGVFASALEFLGIFAPTQLPLAVVEGILTVLIMMALENYAKPELKSIGFFKA